jgi:hypothetical protein
MLTPQQIAELLSLGMTIPTVALAITVVVLWGPAAIQSLRQPEKTGQDWFVIGVTSGFIGAALDNVYWALPWTLSYLGHHETDGYMQAGVYFNIVSRQGLGVIAAACHIKAAECIPGAKARILNTVLAVANLAGLGYVVVLLRAGVVV